MLGKCSAGAWTRTLNTELFLSVLIKHFLIKKMVSWTLASICFLKSMYLFPKLTKMMHMISNILNRYSVEGLNKPVSMH